ncbi:MAG: VWA domain-containing protein [Candidatus Thorarchaeota archaeon]
MVKAAFLEAISNYDPLRFAVYTPAAIPLSERKKVGEILFSSLMGYEIPKIPKWFSPIFKQLTSNSIFVDIKELCRTNPVLSAQITAEIIRSLDLSIDNLLESLKSWLMKEEETDDEAEKPFRIPALQFPGTGKGESDTDMHGGSSLENGSSSQPSESAELPETGIPDESTEEISSGKESDEKIKSRIEEILEGLALLPLEQPLEDYDDLSPEIKQDAQSLIDKSFEDSLEEILAKAKDWESLYELLTAILPGLGWDYSPGFLKNNLLSKYLELSKLLKKIPQLKELADRLGRYHSLMGEKIWDPTAHGKSEVFSVERSGDIERVLPGELVQLGYPTTKYLFYSKLADKSLLTYELRGEGWTQPEKEERGPVVICIDTSGSMSGLPESIAKAVSLAVAKEANSQSRNVHMILFGSRNETKEFTFNKSENAVQSLLDFLNLSFGGGTDFDSALRAALEKLSDDEFRLADVLFITDGYGEIANMNEEIGKVKKYQGTRIFTLLIESENFDATQSISDETWILHLSSSVSPSIAHLRSKLRD